MVMPGNKAYDLKCTKCNWRDTVIVPAIQSSQGILNILAGNKIPSKCPKCGSKITKRENRAIVF